MAQDFFYSEDIKKHSVNFGERRVVKRHFAQTGWTRESMLSNPQKLSREIAGRPLRRITQ